MASDSAVRSITLTLTTTVADTITLLQAWPAIDITNHDDTNDIWVRQDGTTAVASADNATLIPAGQSKVIAASVNEDGQTVISVVGSGGSYTIEGVN